MILWQRHHQELFHLQRHFELLVQLGRCPPALLFQLLKAAQNTFSKSVHVSVTDIILIIHAWTLHHFLGGDLTLELRVKSKVMLKASRTERPKRTR